jgi:hypothetical protein
MREPVRFPYRFGLGYKARLGIFVQNLKHTFACRASGLHQLIQLMQAADGIVKKCHQHQDPDQIAQLQAAGQNVVTTKAQHEQRANCFEHRHRW